MLRARHAALVLSLLGSLAACGSSSSDTPNPVGAGGAGGSLEGGPSDAAVETSAEAASDAGRTTGCNGATLLPVPDDPGARGPWQVGAQTVQVAGLTTEIWYPAAVGSEAGKTQATYDIREHLPAADQNKIPDSQNPLQQCDCYRDLPLDGQHGPYPVIQFIHGTAAFRTQSLTFMTHWASRGFVVVASDHPGIQLSDILVTLTGGDAGASTDQPGDATKVQDALANPTGPLAFLAGHIDMTQLGMSGHSAGGGAVSGFGDRARVIIPMAAGGASAGSALVSTLVMGSQDDGIVPYSSVQSGYDATSPKKRLVGLANAGHLAFSDLCYIGRDQGGILAIALANGVNVPQLIAVLAQDGCHAGQLTAEKGWAIVNYATSAAFEETLSCSPTAAGKLSATQTSFTDVGDYQEALQ